MDVYLIPLGPDRHELYCEVESAVAPDDATGRPSPPRRRPWLPRSGWFRRQSDRFHAMIADAEAERARRERGEASDKGGIGRYVVGKIAEAIAEQRLLWQLRHLQSARLVHPDDIDGARALAMARAAMRLDYGKHRRWCAINLLVTAVTGPLFFFVPGPNIISWYFVFRGVGHYYALRGASQGMDVILWETVPASALSTIRQALTLEPGERRQRLEQLASVLGLDRLAAFVDRVAPRPS